MTTIFCYLRVSTEEQKLESSKMKILEYLVKKNFNTENVIWVDEKISGFNYSYAQRKIGTEILPKIKEGDMFIVNSLSRISRKLSDITKFIEHEVEKKKFTMIVVDKSIMIDGRDTTNAMTKMIIQVLGMCAEFEVNTLKERVKRGIQNYKQKHGRWGRRKGSGKMKLDKHKDEILEYLELGVKKKKLAEKYKVSQNTISNFVKRYKK
jgi:DNA invertase Pin-like site-specific DNA recombinase